MTLTQKQSLITEIVTLLQAKLEVDTAAANGNGGSGVNASTEKPAPQAVEMLTIKECAAEVKGLSEHTIRQLVAQNKLPYIRTGQGKRGKILISKSALLNYFEGREQCEK